MSKTEISDQEKDKEKEKEKINFILEGSLKVIQRKTNDTDKLQVQNYFVLEHLCSITGNGLLLNSQITASSMK